MNFYKLLVFWFSLPFIGNIAITIIAIGIAIAVDSARVKHVCVLFDPFSPLPLYCLYYFFGSASWHICLLSGQVSVWEPEC